MEPIVVIGAGLAGCEAAWQIAKRGGKVTLYEMKPNAFSPAHCSPFFAELVCSNSLKSESIENASGVLKEEMGQLESLILKAARETRVPAGDSLAVDRTAFSNFFPEIKEEQWTDAIKALLPAKLHELNIKAFEEGRKAK